MTQTQGGPRIGAGTHRRCMVDGAIIPKGQHSFKINDTEGGYDRHGRVVGHLCVKHGAECLLQIAAKRRASCKPNHPQRFQQGGA